MCPAASLSRCEKHTRVGTTGQSIEGGDLKRRHPATTNGRNGSGGQETGSGQAATRERWSGRGGGAGLEERRTFIDRGSGGQGSGGTEMKAKSIAPASQPYRTLQYPVAAPAFCLGAAACAQCAAKGVHVCVCVQLRAGIYDPARPALVLREARSGAGCISCTYRFPSYVRSSH